MGSRATASRPETNSVKALLNVEAGMEPIHHSAVDTASIYLSIRISTHGMSAVRLSHAVPSYLERLTPLCPWQGLRRHGMGGGFQV